MAVVAATALPAAAFAGQVFRRHVAHRDHLHVEVERLARHRVVEVHLHGIVADLLHHAQHTLALCVGHRSLAAHEENILGQLAVDHEYRFGEVDDRVVDDFAVAVGGSEREGDLLARFLAKMNSSGCPGRDRSAILPSTVSV